MCSQQPATWPCHESEQSIDFHPPYFFKIHFNISPSAFRSCKWSLSLTLTHLPSSSYLPHGTPPPQFHLSLSFNKIRGQNLSCSYPRNNITISNKYRLMHYICKYHIVHTQTRPHVSAFNGPSAGSSDTFNKAHVQMWIYGNVSGLKQMRGKWSVNERKWSVD
jgi:hypothetical protein